MEKDKLSVLAFAAASVASGVASAFFDASVGLAIGLVVLAALTYVMSKALKEKAKWFVGNGIILYVFFWVISWTLALGVM